VQGAKETTCGRGDKVEAESELDPLNFGSK